jgi:hypothetical protein
MPNFKLIVCLGAALANVAAFAQGQSQTNSDLQSAKSGSPVAYIYVSATLAMATQTPSSATRQPPLGP